MLKQMFVVILEVSSPFDRHFPRVEAQWMATWFATVSRPKV